MPRTLKATNADLGVNPVTWLLIAVQLITLSVAGLLILRLHLSITDWPAEALAAINLGLLGGLWLYLFLVRGRSGSGECRVAETLLIFSLSALYGAIVAIAQYPAIAIGLPYADPWLARADAALGVNVVALAHMTGAHPMPSRFMTAAYVSSIPQSTLTIVGLSLLGDRERLWEFAFHLHLLLAAALISVALWPAVCPPAYYGFTPVIDMTRLIGQIRGFHDGSLTTIHLDQLEGLVSFPSFHAAGALMVIWAWRRRIWVALPVLALNLCVLASTFMTGVHYVIDVIAAVPMFFGSVLVYRWWLRRFLGKPGLLLA